MTEFNLVPTTATEKKPQPPTRRRLGRQHFAFYRAYLEGLENKELANMADSYLSIGTDPRRVAPTLDWLRIELRAAARRTGRRVLMHLLSLPKFDLKADAAHSALPSLEDFQAEVDPDRNFYPEDELLAMYKERYGAQQLQPSRQQRQALKRHKDRLAALAELEMAVAEAPLPTHALDGWLDPITAKHLIAANVTTLDQLQSIIRAGGYRWYKNVPRLGERSAQRVMTFFKENATTLGAPPSRALQPLRKSAPTVLAQDYAFARRAVVFLLTGAGNPFEACSLADCVLEYSLDILQYRLHSSDAHGARTPGAGPQAASCEGCVRRNAKVRLH